MWRTVHLRSGGVSSVLFAIVVETMSRGARKNYDRFSFFFLQFRCTMKHERDDDWTTWELHLAEMQRVSRAIPIKALWARREVSRRHRASWNSWYLGTSTFPFDSNIFILTRKAFYPGCPRLFVTRLGSFIFITPWHLICLSLSPWITLIISRRCYISDKSRSTSKVKIRKFATFDKSPFLATLVGGRDIFTLRILYPSQIYVRCNVHASVVKISRRENGISSHYAGTRID